MKKILSIIAMALIMVLPYSVNADTKIDYSCGSKNAEGIRTCTIGYEITEVESNLTVTLTEGGGATITDISAKAGEDWTIADKREVNGVWTVDLTAAGVTGEGDLFVFSYQDSGTADCKVTIALGDKKVEITENEDKPTDNKDTGIEMPYVAVGAITLIAVGTYLVTKNKAKMYKI